MLAAVEEENTMVYRLLLTQSMLVDAGVSGGDCSSDFRLLVCLGVIGRVERFQYR